MPDRGSADILSGWIVPWNSDLMWLLAAIVVGLGAIALVEVIAAIRAGGR